MKKKYFVIVCNILFIASSVFAQVPADSLKGTYAGTVYVKVLSTDPWTIGPDTLFVQIFDTVNCNATMNICGWQVFPLYQSYTYCTSSMPINHYARFYSMDSLTAIADSNTIQPPCQTGFSIRFYGKRISSNYGLGVNQMEYKKPELIVYPNPTQTILFVECKTPLNKNAELKITDMEGKEIKKINISAQKAQVDISNLANGSYFVNLKTDKGIIAKKIVVQR